MINDGLKTELDAPEEVKAVNKEKAPAEKPQEPIYYIVERKKRLPKSGFEDAKPFTFKND